MGAGHCSICLFDVIIIFVDSLVFLGCFELFL